MVVRTIRYNLNKSITRKDLETHYCMWSYSLYHNHYSSFLLDRRYSYNNVYTSFEIKSLSLSISNKDVLTPNFDALISNFFFLRYFTGKKPFFLPVKVFSSFHEKRYSYICQVQLKKEEAFYFFSKYITYASNTLSSLDFNIKHKPLSKNIAGFYMKDFSYFRVVGSHMAFLDWKANLDIELVFNRTCNVKELSDLLDILKLNRHLTLSLNKL